MIALDTNLLARLLLRDDEAQHQRVKALLKKPRQTFTAPVTVFLELVWVLESRDCSVKEVVMGLTALLDLPNFKPDRANAIREALRNYDRGMGFADALHLALSEGEQSFRTFDKAFVRLAKKMSLSPDVVLA